MTFKFKLMPDLRTDYCTHSQMEGCHHCCSACNYDIHKCGACSTPMNHETCSGQPLGWCNECRIEHLQDEETL